MRLFKRWRLNNSEGEHQWGRLNTRTRPQWGQPKPPEPNCTHEEEQALLFDNVLSDRGREPSYSHDWGTTAILPGRFGGRQIAPIHGTAKDYKYFWLTFGGEDTDSRSWMETAEDDIKSVGAHGAAFDIEGGVTPKDMHAWVLKMREKHPTWTYVYIPQAADDMVGYTEDGPDYAAPMLYYSNYNSYPVLDISKGNQKSESVNALLKLRKAGWPASRTILTYQSFDAGRSRAHGDNTLLPLLGKLLGNFSVNLKVYGEMLNMQGPYAGVLGWPAQCGHGDNRCWPDADKDNMLEVMKGAKESGLQANMKDRASGDAPGAREITEPCPGHPHVSLSSPSCTAAMAKEADKAAKVKAKAAKTDQGPCPGHPNILRSSPSCKTSDEGEGAGFLNDSAPTNAELRRAMQQAPQKMGS